MLKLVGENFRNNRILNSLKIASKILIENKEEKGSFGGIVLSVNLLGTYTGTYGASLVA